MIQIGQNNVEFILIFAFRYAIGRMTYAPSILLEELKRNWNEFGPGTKKQIKDDIIRQKEIDGLGMGCDQKLWLEILEWD